MRYQTLTDLKRFKEYFQGETIHDMGGNSELYRKKQGYDISKLFHQKIITVDILSQPGVDIVDNLEELNSIKSNSVDNIICSDVLEHGENPFNIVNTFFRVLKSGGIIYLSTVFLYPIHGDVDRAMNFIIDYWRFTPQCLLKLFKKFHVIESGFQKGYGDHHYSFDRYKKGVYILAKKE